MTPSNYFDLSGWKLTVPVDSAGKTSGEALEVKNLAGYEQSSSFFDGADGAMVFNASVDGATTSGSKYPRSELREMNGSSLAYWDLDTGGSMSATVAVNKVPTLFDGTPGRVVIGQIHGREEELVRIYWDKNTVYFQNDQAGPKNNEMRFDFKDANGQTPNVSLNEKFSYSIDAKGDQLVVKVFADGHEYTSTSKINDVWQSDAFYFKAGIYLGVNETSGTGSGQTSFYHLDYSHDEVSRPPSSESHSGTDGAVPPVSAPAVITPPVTTPPVSTTPSLPSSVASGNTFEGSATADIYTGGSGNDTIRGRDGNDKLNGGAGNDNIEGNGGNDTITGGLGADTIKGGDGADIFVWKALNEGGDIIKDLRAEDRLDVSALLSGFSGGPKAAFDGGYIKLIQDGSNVRLDIDADGKDGAGGSISLATLLDTKVSSISQSQFVVSYSSAPQNSSTTPAPTSTVPASTSTPPAPTSTSTPASNTTDMLGTSGKDAINGGDAADIIRGFAGDDTLKGKGGNDIIDGGEGKDKIEGGNGNDVLIGGFGDDTLKGGEGADIFKFAANHGHDTIEDLRVEDTLLLDHSFFANAEAVRNAFIKSGDDYILHTGSDAVILFEDVKASTIHNVHIDFF